MLSEAPVLGLLGWNEHFRTEFEPHALLGHEPGRVATQHRGVYVLATAEGEVEARITGRARFDGDFPAVGDWVAYSDGLIQALLPRRTAFVRRAAGNETVEQVLAANVDTVFLVMAFYRDLNPRRLERYLALAWESGADPAIVLTKLDLAEDAEAAIAEIESVAIGVPVHPVSSVTGAGLDELEPYLAPGRTVVLLGSSGVGKSTLVNALLGEERQATKEIRAFDGRGRHTTTARELIALPGGGLVLDTPGMRELQLWDAGEGMVGTFGDIDELALQCRFSDCQHESEPGCAVRDAVDADRLDSWRKLGRELRHLELKQDARARSEQRKEWRRFTKSMRNSAW